MATDLATLAIKVENGDVIKTTTSLNSMEVAGTKAEASTNRLTRRMALLEIQAREMDAAMVKGTSATARLASAMGLSEAAVGKLASAFAAFSAAAVAGFIGHKLIEETEAAQAAMAQLEAAVKATGGAAGRSVAQLDELSLALQKTTTFSDEAVKGAEAVLLTFNKIKGEEFDRATVAVTDLATRMGKDLPEAALQVGKALQDPVEGLQALQRLGVRFSASQKLVIRDLIDTGHAAEAQQIILEKLESTFSGSAAAARDTLGGALKGLSNDFGDLFERTKDETSALVNFINATDGVVRGLHTYSDAAKSVGLAVGGIAVAYGIATIAAKSFAVQAVLGGAATAAEGLIAALTGVGAVGGIALAPIALLAGAASLAIYDLTAAFQDYDDKVEEASKNTKEYVEYLKALGRAHAHAPELAAPQADDLTDAGQKFAAQVAQRDAEIGKLAALNAAYRQSEVALALLGIQYDAQIKKSEDVAGHTPREIAILNARTDALTRQKVAQVLLNDQLDREAKLRSVRATNADALRSANERVITAGQDAPTAERTQNRLEELNKLQDAERQYHDQIRRATAEQRADAKVAYDETVARIHKEADLNDAAITKARDAATTLSVGLTVSDTEAQTAGLRAMIAAELEGGRAVEEMSVQLAGNEAVQRAVNDATARGTEITKEQAAALRGSAEELERTRIAADKLRTVYREVSGAVHQFFEDVFNRKNPAPAIAARIKAEIIAAVSRPIEAKITAAVVKILGIDVPLSKQEKAAKDMNTAADKQLKAAQIMAGSATSETYPDGGIADASTVFNPVKSAARQQWEKAMGVAGAGLGGYGAGYGIGQATGSGAIGAVGGAVAGAKLGAAFGPAGMAAGALAGFVGGIVGAGDAAKEAAARLQEARRVFKNTWDGIIADINGDELAKAIIGADDRFQQARQQYLDAHLIDILHGHTDEFRKGYEDIAKVQAEYIEMLKLEAAAKARARIESYRERELRAEGKTAEADALARDEERQQLIDSFGKEIDATERQILAALDAAQAAERNTKALNSLTTSVNTVTGFKLSDLRPYIQEFGKGQPYPGKFQPPTNPFVPPTTPLSQPRLSLSSSTGTVATTPASVTFAAGSIVVQESKSPQATAEAIAQKVSTLFVQKLDAVRRATTGPTGTRSDALERMPS